MFGILTAKFGIHILQKCWVKNQQLMSNKYLIGHYGSKLWSLNEENIDYKPQMLCMPCNRKDTITAVNTTFGAKK